MISNVTNVFICSVMFYLIVLVAIEILWENVKRRHFGSNHQYVGSPVEFMARIMMRIHGHEASLYLH